MKLTEEPAAAAPAGVRGESPAEGPRDEAGPARAHPDPAAPSRAAADAPPCEGGQEPSEGGGPGGTVKT